jgi:transposase
VLCRSRDRREKEQAMHTRFEKRIEEGLAKIATGCVKRRQPVAVIERRVGRLLGQNTRAAGLFDVQVRADRSGKAQITWKKVETWRAWAQLSEGSYLLRSNVRDWSDEDLWRAYIQLTEAEAAFRIQKSDLSIRPVWHHQEDRVRAHILVCFLAYVLWKFLGQLCQKAGLGDEPRRVLAELGELRAVDVILPTQDGRELRTRCVTQPSDHQEILLNHLDLKLPGQLHPSEL